MTVLMCAVNQVEYTIVDTSQVGIEGFDAFFCVNFILSGGVTVETDISLPIEVLGSDSNRKYNYIDLLW